MSSETITRNDLTAILNEIFPSIAMVDFFYPVGSYYETSDTTFNPNVSWGGTWSLETAGQVHVSAGTGYAVSGALTNTSDGGESEHILVVDELPKITGDFSIRRYATSGGTVGSTITSANGVMSVGVSSTTTNGVQASTGTVGSQKLDMEFGNNQPHENMQPYIVVNRWHRTA